LGSGVLRFRQAEVCVEGERLPPVVSGAVVVRDDLVGAAEAGMGAGLRVQVSALSTAMSSAAV
jgi:hypothetical protein